LTALAGWVDAIGFLRLGGLYPSFMSGNTTQLGIAVAHVDLVSAFFPAILVALFVAGALVGAAVTELATRWGLVVCFCLEALLLAAALTLSAQEQEAALALAPLPAAMGLQNATAGRLTKAGLGITFVTGSLVRLGQGCASALRGGPAFEWLLPALTWLAMMAGATGGGATYATLGPLALAVPALCVAAIAVVAAVIAGAGQRWHAGPEPVDDAPR